MPAVDHWPAIISDLEGAINAAWPELFALVETGDWDKIDWEELDRRGEEHFPIALYHMPEFEMLEDYGGIAAPWKTGKITVAYIAIDSGDILATLRTKMNTLEYTLLTNGGSYVFGVTPYFSVSWGPDNNVNSRLLNQKLSLTGAEVTFKAVVPGALSP